MTLFRLLDRPSSQELFSASSGSVLLHHSSMVFLFRFWRLHALAFPKKRRGKKSVARGRKQTHLLLNGTVGGESRPFGGAAETYGKRSISGTAPSAKTFSSRIYTHQRSLRTVFWVSFTEGLLCITFLSLRFVMRCPGDDSGGCFFYCTSYKGVSYSKVTSRLDTIMIAELPRLVVPLSCPACGGQYRCTSSTKQNNTY